MGFSLFFRFSEFLGMNTKNNALEIFENKQFLFLQDAFLSFLSSEKTTTLQNESLNFLLF